MCLHVELLSLATRTLWEYCSVAKSCPAVCDHMDCSTPDLPVHHCLLEFTQMHVHGVGDAIQPSHPLSLPSPVLNLSQHQVFFQWVGSSHHFSSVQFSRSVVSYSLRPHGLQHARPPCLSNILATILHIRWPNYWSFSFSISPFNEYLGLISFRMDSLDLLVIQGTLKSLLQHHSSKASILWRSAFFMIQLLHPYMTTGKTIALRYVNTL